MARKEQRISIGLWWRKPEGERSLGRLGVDGRVLILKRILQKYDEKGWAGLYGLKQGYMAVVLNGAINCRFG